MTFSSIYPPLSFISFSASDTFLNSDNFPVKHLDETIDYTLLYELIRLRMQKPTKLLETLATEIAQETLDKFLKIDEVMVNVKKINPPIPFFKGSVAAEYCLKRI